MRRFVAITGSLVVALLVVTSSGVADTELSELERIVRLEEQVSELSLEVFGEQWPSTTTAPPTTTVPPTTTEPPAPVGFNEDFLSPASVDRFQFALVHWNDVSVAETEWLADHQPIEGNDPDACTGPFEKRVVTRGERPVFNDDWNFRCAPGDDPTKAHLMTSIGDTSGFSSGAFSPAQVFDGISEVRWSVNITDLGNRQWTEVGIVPGNVVHTPCSIEFTGCKNINPFNSVLGSVSATFFESRPSIHNGVSLVKDSVTWKLSNAGDPALSSPMIRRQHFFRDNGDGTLTFGVEQPDGSFREVTAAGSFPDGPVRVVFSDQNYEPTRGPIPDDIGKTWHWDDLSIK